MEDKYDHEKLFGHVRQSKYDFKSEISVANLLFNNKDLFAIGVVFETSKELRFHRYTEKCHNSLEASDIFDRRRIAYAFCCNIDDHQKDNSGHSGDCICLPATCTLCMSESLYSSALEIYDEWKTIGNDSYINLLEVLLSTEHLWQQCDNLFDLAFKASKSQTPGLDHVEIGKQRDELWNNLWDIRYCYKYWQGLSLEEREYCHQRAVRFRNYFDNRPIVEGIPWW